MQSESGELDVQSLKNSITVERRERNISQRELAEKADVSNTTISRIERGAVKNPSLNEIYKIATILEVRIDDLILDRGITHELKQTLSRLEEKVGVTKSLFNRRGIESYSIAMKKDLNDYFKKIERDL